MRRFLAAAATALLFSIGTVAATAEVAQAAPSSGTLAVTVQAPDGVAANITVRRLLASGTIATVAKPAAGTSSMTRLPLAPGNYLLGASSTVAASVRYVPSAAISRVTVLAGRTAAASVRFAKDGGATDLHVTALGSGSVSFAWSGPSGARYVLLRSGSGMEPRDPGDGAIVPVQGTTAEDVHLIGGKSYRYWLFTRSRTGWRGPYPLAVATPSSAPSASAPAEAFVPSPSTLLAKPADISSETPTGDGLDLGLGASTATPVVGAAVVLPVSAALPGGYLGIVSSISTDGRTVHLTPASLDQAFDYYTVSIPSFSSEPTTTSATTASAAPIHTASMLLRTAPAVAAATTPGPNDSCGADTTVDRVSFVPHFGISGRYNMTFNRNGAVAGVPDGVTLDMGVSVHGSGAASLEASAAISCTLAGLDHKYFQLSTEVPTGILFEPVADITTTGKVSVTNVGATVTAGFTVSGTASTAGGAAFSGSLVHDAQALSPTATLGGSVGLRLGGAITLGFGVGSDAVGVIAGIKGQLNVMNAEVSATVPASSDAPPACDVVTIGGDAAASWSAKAWFGGWSQEAEIPIAELGQWTYPGSPWSLPDKCDTGESVPTDPPSASAPQQGPITDPGLAECIQGQQQADGVPISPVPTTGDLATLTRLDCRAASSLRGWPALIADTSQLAFATKMTSLVFDGNGATTGGLAPLAHLTALTSLDAEHANITDASPLLTMTGLTSVNLSYNGITDVSMLRPMLDRTVLSIGNQSKTDSCSIGYTCSVDLPAGFEPGGIGYSINGIAESYCTVEQTQSTISCYDTFGWGHSVAITDWSEQLAGAAGSSYFGGEWVVHT